MPYCPVPSRPRRLISLLGACLLSACGSPSPPGATAKTAKPEPPHRVEITTARLEAPRLRLEYTGSLRARRSLRVFTQEEGRLEQLPFYPGDRVEAGELLLQLDARRLQAEFDRTQAELKQAKTNLGRLQSLSKNNLVSEEERLRAETALAVAQADLRLLQARIDDTQVRAPFAGLVSARLAEPGDVVGRYSHVLSLIDPESLVADIQVPEQALAQLHVGDSVQLRIDAVPGPELTTQVSRIYPSLDPATRHGTVELRLEHLPSQARDGQFCRADFELTQAAHLLVPALALRQERDGEYLFVLDAEQKVHRTPVRSGTQYGQDISISEGLAAGQQVVSKGFLKLQDGQSVTVNNPSVVKQ